MSFLKGFGTSILGLLLFLSLSVFSIAFILNSTMLNPGFITKQVDRIDISSVARDVAEEQIGDELPPELEFLREAIFNAIDAQEPWVKEQLNQAIDAGYDFFLDKTDQLQIIVPLDDFKEDLKNNLWQELKDQLDIWLRDNIDSELRPFIEENLQDYREVLPEDIALLSDEDLKSYLDTFLDQIHVQIIAMDSAPVLSDLLETLIRPYFDVYYNEFAEQIPAELTSADIPDDVMEELLLIKKYIGYFRSAFYWLIAFMVLLAGGIFLIHRNIQDPSRTLGIDLVVFGALELIGALVLRFFNPATYLPDEAASLETWLTGLFNDVTSIMLTFSIIILAVGAALIVISFIFKKKPAEG